MKLSRQFLLSHLLLLSSFASFAGEKDTTEASHYSGRFNVEKIRSLRTIQDDDVELRHVELGVRYMPTFSSIDFNTSDGGVVEGSFTMSHGFGVMAGINLTKNIGVQAEVNYYQINQKYADGNLNRDLTINYFNIPVLLSLNTNKAAPVNLNLVAGPQFGINAGSKFETSGNGNTDSTTAVVALRKGDVGVAYGAGLEFALNKSHSVRLDLGFRGFYGLVNMDSSTNGQGTYNVIVSASRKTYGGYAGITWMF
ncbi:porin family protein [Cytophaga hutchinsonii]|jgi:opacity protein-like surface antigen|uniref:Outer membrane protein beta-barrel domain-containing protein n=1 Tax=Cytophaga hutchinsonii (strain ATCC 33406 / DSM 1761 / CIP 103989 / NBRC 15051 / NCIMB 9469 / D465) TaxID=269798 RepID=A0A6N4STM5_CYTH3|nr:porin family protein [Cytophaga hutchinsonii]ABG59803.1 hypothetical protein CHU_2550 [Cytophaga hutchinsonii ATCC 33406]SFX29527.1 Outer membrane protein beta-barrel domain-containing protein [Cytophaga hutchinsonii ATCC 33406]